MTQQQNKVVFRIDNRLVHGQIAVNWKQALQVDTIVVPDDEIARDSLKKTLMKMATQTANIQSYFLLTSKAPVIIKELAQPQVTGLLGKPTKKKIFVVCRTPHVVRQLIEKGVATDNVTVWNMFKADNKKQIFGTVYMDQSDIEDVVAIKKLGVEVKIQETPYSQKVEIPDQL